MNDTFSIKQVEQIINVPAATLRFWEEQGLFSVPKKENQYRVYSMRELITIADVLFYRNLGVPIKDISKFQNYSLDEYESAMENITQTLSEKIALYQDMFSRVQHQVQCLSELQELMTHEFIPAELPFHAVASFDFREKDKLIRYSKSPNCYVRYYDTRDMFSETRGIIVEDDYEKPVLWRKNRTSNYIAFLIRERAEKNFESDLEITLSKIQKKYQTGHLLAQYLLSLTEHGERIDFLKGYLEIF